MYIYMYIYIYINKLFSWHGNDSPGLVSILHHLGPPDGHIVQNRHGLNMFAKYILHFFAGPESDPG